MVFFKNISSNIFFTKFFGCFVVFALVFNVMFSALKINNQIDFNEVSNIQKDVFSTVFFVSDAVSKISRDILSKIVAKKTAQPEDNTKSKHPVSDTSSDFVLKPNFEKSNQVLNFFSAVWFAYPVNFKVLEFYDKHRMQGFVVFYFMLMLLFFTSVKNMYDSFSNKNVKIYYLKPALF